MSDDDYSITLDEDDVQEIIDWALNASTNVVLMHNHPEPKRRGEARQKLEDFANVVNNLIEDMPDVLLDIALDIAEDRMKSVIEKDVISRFQEELKDL